MCILVIALQCHPTFPFICAHNRDEERDRPSLEDGIETDTQLLCGRDAQAGGFVLGLHVQHGHFAALTNCRCRVRWISTERTSRGLLVEHLASQGPHLAEFVRERKIDPYHVVCGEIFQAIPEVHYFWNTPEDSKELPPSPETCHWSRGHQQLGPGVFVVSNENPTETASWPKCLWLKEEVTRFLQNLGPSVGALDLQQGLGEIMSRYDVPGLGPPKEVPKVLPKEVEMKLHSGPFCPWRPGVKRFGTVSQRILVCDSQAKKTHYFHRSTNEPASSFSDGPRQAGPWKHIEVPWEILPLTAWQRCFGAAWTYCVLCLKLNRLWR